MSLKCFLENPGGKGVPFLFKLPTFHLLLFSVCLSVVYIPPPPPHPSSPSSSFINSCFLSYFTLRPYRSIAISKHGSCRSQWRWVSTSPFALQAFLHRHCLLELQPLSLDYCVTKTACLCWICRSAPIRPGLCRSSVYPILREVVLLIQWRNHESHLIRRTYKTVPFIYAALVEIIE